MADRSLFAEFPPVPTSAWMDAVARDLKGADFERRLVSTTLDGVRVPPFARAEDVPAGGLPAARGSRRAGNAWAMREEIRDETPDGANAHAVAALERGAEQVAFYGYPIGVFPDSAKTVETLLEGIALDTVAVHWLTGPLAAPTLALVLDESDRRGVRRERLTGSVEIDPILDACAGWRTDGDWQAELLGAVGAVAERLPNYGLLTVRGAMFEKAGASIGQELAWTLGVFAEYLVACAEATQDGRPALTLDDLVRRSELRFGVATSYLLEVAKFRALRVLLANLLEAFGVSSRPRVHAVTTSTTKTLYDPMNNILRATVEATAAVVAGVDSLTVGAFDQGYHVPDEFSAHLARNTETLLKDEARLDRVADPLGGSYSVETLTAAYAEAAWAELRRIEEAGGFWAAWRAGTVREALCRVCADRAKAVERRRRAIVGTTVYPDLTERRLSELRPSAPPRRVAPCFGREGGFDRVAKRVREEGLGAWLLGEPALPGLPPYRPSQPYEELRLAVERHVEGGGTRPIVRLALLGDPAMRSARAAFCTGFFGAGGFDVRQAVYSDAAAAALEAREEGAVRLVLCSADAEYVEHAERAVSVGDAVPVVVAGYPEDSIDRLRAAGVREFVHVRTETASALRGLHAECGIGGERALEEVR